eukprot:m.295441 g.295441  ORF g.295441 m.295441 type:complete len:370 (-) comp13198_c0_seq1:1260-2369(-)
MQKKNNSPQARMATAYLHVNEATTVEGAAEEGGKVARAVWSLRLEVGAQDTSAQLQIGLDKMKGAVFLLAVKVKLHVVILRGTRGHHHNVAREQNLLDLGRQGDTLAEILDCGRDFLSNPNTLKVCRRQRRAQNKLDSGCAARLGTAKAEKVSNSATSTAACSARWCWAAGLWHLRAHGRVKRRNVALRRTGQANLVVGTRLHDKCFGRLTVHHGKRVELGKNAVLGCDLVLGKFANCTCLHDDAAGLLEVGLEQAIVEKTTVMDIHIHLLLDNVLQQLAKHLLALVGALEEELGGGCEQLETDVVRLLLADIFNHVLENVGCVFHLFAKLSNHPEQSAARFCLLSNEIRVSKVGELWHDAVGAVGALA